MALRWGRKAGFVGLALLLWGGCPAQVQRRTVFEKTVALPAGRFVGPVEMKVPRKVDDPFVVYEIRATLTAQCAPRLRLAFPDGESKSIGAKKRRWQELLAERAKGERAPASAGASEPAPPPASPSGAGEATDAVVATGTWQKVATDSWPGQLEFLDLRASLCASASSWTTRYDTALDENGRISIWADVPQELQGASLTVRIVEATDVDERRELDLELEARRRGREGKIAERQRREAERQRRRAAKPRPPRPAPKRESPGRPEAEGATWISGQWIYSEGRGKWMWVAGRWQQPANTPADRVEARGQPPVAGCRWQGGHWVWVEGPGAWHWEPGYWLAPPPRPESPGPPPVPESPWVPGRWVTSNGSFEWITGHWGNPTPRDEKLPPPPFVGAKWRPGLWIKVRDQWKWSPGYYEDGSRKPPPPKAETKGPKPHPESIWLAGFWRWSAEHGQHQWVDGHWEVPPGEGYVWVPDPPDPQTGISVRGNWKLRIDLDVKVPR